MITLLSKHRRYALALSCLATILACFSMLPAATAHAAGETAEFPVTTFIKEVIAAYGGEPRLARITSVYATGSIEAFMRGDRGISTRYFKRQKIEVRTRLSEIFRNKDFKRFPGMAGESRRAAPGSARPI